MPIPRFRRLLLLTALGPLCWLATQSCVSNRLLCPSASSSQTSGSPCDVFAANHTACVAAFSTARALYASYSGPLYQVMRKSDSATANIGLLADGYANAAAQDGFCATTTCTITKIYDQSPNHNDLLIAPPGVGRKGAGPGGHDLPAVADALPVTAGGHKVYGVYIAAGVGYRNDATQAIPAHGQPEGVYMVGSGIHVNSGCCFDLGNAETNDHDNGPGHMDAINLRCDEQGNLRVGLDMEAGTYPRALVPPGIPFVTALGSNDGQHNYTVYWGNSRQGCLTSTGLLPLPKGYSPMQQEGAIILGIGGDNSNWDEGSFFEGAMTAGAPPGATLSAIQANVVSVRYAATPP